jgi:hypothetical protein
MSFELYKSIVDKYENRTINLGGAECFCHSQVEKFIKYALKNNKIDLLTNGTMLMDHEKFFRSLSKEELNKLCIVVSFNSGIRDQVERLKKDFLAECVKIYNFFVNELGVNFIFSGIKTDTKMEQDHIKLKSRGVKHILNKCPLLTVDTLDFWSYILTNHYLKVYYDTDGVGPLTFVENILKIHEINKSKVSELTEDEKDKLRNEGI